MSTYTNGSSTCQAVQITGLTLNLDRNEVLARLEGGRELLVSEFAPRFEPEVGDYFVRQDADGYAYFCPKATFEEKYRKSGELTYGDALYLLRQGKKLARAGWNGKGMFVYLVPGSTFTVNRAPLLGIYPEGTEITYRDHLDMKYADGSCGVWLASQSDQLVDDWGVVE